MDWIQFHQQFNLRFDRDDSYWTQHLAMYFNAHKPENHKTLKPDDFIPWKEPRDIFANPYSPDELKKKLGF